jgi:flavin-binding protein dodecin
VAAVAHGATESMSWQDLSSLITNIIESLKISGTDSGALVTSLTTQVTNINQKYNSMMASPVSSVDEQALIDLVAGYLGESPDSINTWDAIETSIRNLQTAVSNLNAQIITLQNQLDNTAKSTDLDAKTLILAQAQLIISTQNSTISGLNSDIYYYTVKISHNTDSIGAINPAISARTEYINYLVQTINDTTTQLSAVQQLIANVASQTSTLNSNYYYYTVLSADLESKITILNNNSYIPLSNDYNGTRILMRNILGSDYRESYTNADLARMMVLRYKDSLYSLGISTSQTMDSLVSVLNSKEQAIADAITSKSGTVSSLTWAGLLNGVNSIPSN